MCIKPLRKVVPAERCAIYCTKTSGLRTNINPFLKRKLYIWERILEIDVLIGIRWVWVPQTGQESNELLVSASSGGFIDSENNLESLLIL